MSSKLQVVTIERPGEFGANSELGAGDPRWLLTSADYSETKNLVFGDLGRLEVRKKIDEITTSGGHGTDVTAMFEYWADEATSQVIHASNLKLYEGTTSLTEVTGTITTPTANDWMFVNFNGACIGIQQDHTAIVYTGISFANISAASGSVPDGDAGLSAFGRLWITDADKTTLKFSAVLDETHWATGAGSLDTLNVWPDGFDTITALAEWQNQLLIIGTRSTLVYTGAEDPTASTFVLADIIRIGTKYRDSVVPFGDDLAMMGDSGLISLKRGVQFSNLELAQLAPQVKSAVLADLATPLKGVYSSQLNALMYVMGSTHVTWIFDLTQRLEDGSLRALPWLSTNIGAMISHSDGTLYFGIDGDEISSAVAKYDGYISGDEGNVISSLQTAFSDFGYPGDKALKVVQFEAASTQGTAGLVDATWAVDYGFTFYANDQHSVSTSTPPRLQPFSTQGSRTGRHISIRVRDPSVGTRVIFGPITIHFKVARSVGRFDGN